MSHATRNKDLGRLNQELSYLLNRREDDPDSIEGPVTMAPTNRTPYSRYWGSNFANLVERSLILTQDTKRYSGKWAKGETVTLSKPVSDLFTRDVWFKKTKLPSLQSPANTAANNRKIKGKVTLTRKPVSAAPKQAITAPIQVDEVITETGHLQDANEKSYTDYHKYFRR